MAFYEILIRGNPDGSQSGAHLIEFVQYGAGVDGLPLFRPGDPRPITAETLAQYVPAQYAALSAQVSALTGERDALKTERDRLRAQVDAAQPQSAANAVTALQGRLAINTVAGLRARIEASVAASDQNTRDFWEFAPLWRRDDALLNALAAQVELTAQQVDDLFTLAHTL